MQPLSIGKKTKKVLKTLLVVFTLIFLRIWQLNVLQRDEHLTKAIKPQRRWVIDRPERGLIQDREGVPLAINQICYNACIYYGNILEIPRVQYKLDDQGNRTKIFKRKNYIEELSYLLSDELKLDQKRTEDLIHSKAALFPHTPFVLKKNISEDAYYRLKMLERKWPGLSAETTSIRVYPQKKVACNVLGYMGAIGQKEYYALANEIKHLKNYFKFKEEGLDPILPVGIRDAVHAANRLHELTEKAYSIHDSIGKSGVEYSQEHNLRGYLGHKTFEVDVKGNFLKELPGSKEPLPGKNITLNLSYELQKYAEELLIVDERTRDGRSWYWDYQNKKKKELKQPWIKGGAIVALDPNSGEVLALASNPRFDPNDFIYKSDEQNDERISHIHQCFETERHIADIWNGKKHLTRERHSKKRGIFEEKLKLTWNVFLDFILPQDSSVYKVMPKKVKTAINLQEDMEFLLYYSGQKNLKKLFETLYTLKDNEITQQLSQYREESQSIWKKWSPLFDQIPSHDDKAFLVDLMRLAVFSPAFTDELIHKLGSLSIDEYFSLSQQFYALEKRCKIYAQELYHNLSFAPWRKVHGKAYLKEMRAREKQLKTYARPYVDYFDKKEKKAFKSFWKENRLHLLTCYLLGKGAEFQKAAELGPYYTYFLVKHKQDQHLSETINLHSFARKLSPQEVTSFVRTIRSYDNLDRPLYHQSYRLRAKKGHQVEKHLAASFYPLTGFGFGRSYAYRQSTPLGSIFKIVTGYAALLKKYNELKKDPEHFLDLNPFEMIDEVRWDTKVGKKGGTVVGYQLNQKPYPRFYKGGRLPRSAHTRIGRLNLMTAIERTSNPYFALIAGDYLDSPQDLIKACKTFYFGQKSNLDIPGEISGNLPQDLERNKTGLYSSAIGQHSLIVTPLQTSNMLSAISNGGSLYKPRIIRKIEGPKRKDLTAKFNFPTFPLEEPLKKLGFSFPIFTSLLSDDESYQKWTTPELLNKAFLSEKMRELLYHAMNRVTHGEYGTARAHVVKGLLRDRPLYDYYKTLDGQFVGKTSTAEIMHSPFVLPSAKAQMYKHIWFGSVSYKKTKGKTMNHPELVVVVFLQFGDGGKEAMPLALKMVKKYREMQKEKAAKK